MRFHHRRRLRWILLGIFLIAGGYVGFRVAAHNGWVIVTLGDRSFDQGTAPKPGDPTQELSLFVVGDTGTSTENRRHVIDAMRKLAKKVVIDDVLLVGDNFYESGVTSVDDPRFQSDFEGAFGANDFDCPFLVCLGNHDHYGNVGAQVQYTNVSRRWKMPARYFRVRELVGNETADVFVIDTVPILEGRSSAKVQLAWLERELAASNAKWKIVMGHHPALTGGRHEVSEVIGKILPPILEKHDVDLYLSGHDHDLQLNDSGHGWLQIVSGAGAKLRSTHWIDETLFARATPGFCWLLIRDDELSISFYSPTERLFSYVVQKEPDSNSAISR